ncbi:MAG TPA: MFS transporter [Solirubrobacterales bacterium]|nr:MFS transporter [Solirubrobacterales bacterium]
MDASVTDQPRSGPPEPAQHSAAKPAAKAATPLFAFLLVAVNLRIAVVALSPLLDDIKATEHLTDTAAGLLTTLPLACFGAFAFLVPWLTRHLGARRLPTLSMAILSAGILLWLIPGLLPLFGGALVAGAGIGIGNIGMPGMLKRDFAARSHLATGLYTTMLFIGGTVGAGLTVPLRDALGIDWRQMLALWAIPAIVALIVWMVFAGRGEPEPEMEVDRDADSDPASTADATLVRAAASGPVPAAAPAPTAAPPGPSLRALMHDRVAWAVTCFMGIQSLGYYAFVAWLPTLLQDHGMSAGKAGWMLSFATFPGIIGALGTPVLDRRLGGGPTLVLLASASAACGFVGLIVAPVSLAYLWMILLGLAQGACISLAIAYIVARSPDHEHTGKLSAMAQGFGYLLACLGPLALGAVHSATGSWTVPLIVLIAVLGAQVAAGLQASRPRHVLAGRKWS